MMKTIALMILSAAAMASQLPNQDSTQLPPFDNAAGSAETSHTDGPSFIDGLPAELFLKATICAQTLDLRMAEPHMVVATYLNPVQ